MTHVSPPKATTLLLCLGLLLGCSSGPDEKPNGDAPPGETSEAAIQQLADRIGVQVGQLRPYEIPASEIRPSNDYRIGPNDVISIQIHELERPDQTSKFKLVVSETGRVSLPILGEVEAGKQTVQKLKTHIVQRLQERYMVDPQVQVSVTTYRSAKIRVNGEVKKPGDHVIPCNDVNVIEALSLAGGPTLSAGRQAVLVKYRGPGKSPQRLEIDLEMLLRSGNRSMDYRIEPGDVLTVPRAEQVYVLGWVGRPGAQKFERGMTALQALVMAGGHIPGHASPAAAFVIRRKGAGKRATVINIDIEEIMEGTAPDQALLPGDSLVIPQTTWRAAGLETLDFFKSRLKSMVPGSPF